MARLAPPSCLVPTRRAVAKSVLIDRQLPRQTPRDIRVYARLFIHDPVINTWFIQIRLNLIIHPNIVSSSMNLRRRAYRTNFSKLFCLHLIWRKKMVRKVGYFLHWISFFTTRLNFFFPRNLVCEIWFIVMAKHKQHLFRLWSFAFELFHKIWPFQNKVR